MDREKNFKGINSMDHTKVCLESDIPTKIIKKNVEVLHLSSNASVNEITFPSILKIFKDNYRSISIFKNLSKVFENIMYKQMATFMDKYFSKFQCGFRRL